MMTDIIVKSINFNLLTYVDENDIEKNITPETAYLLPKNDGTTDHERYVTDKFNILSKNGSIDLSRIAAIENKNIQQDSDIVINKNKNTQQDLEIDDLQFRTLNLEGIRTQWNPTTLKLTLFDLANNVLSEISLLSLDNEGTDLRYNSTTHALELWNGQEELIDTIPILEFVGNVISQAGLNSNTLQLKDAQGFIIASVNFQIANIGGLQDALNTLQSSVSNEVIARQNADDLKLDKATQTISAPDITYKYIDVRDENNAGKRVLADSVGKNIANSNPTSIVGAGMTLGSPYTWNTGGFPLYLTGLIDKSSDSTFNTFLSRNANGSIGFGSGLSLITNGMSSSNDIQKDNFRIASRKTNETYSIGQPQISIISPPIVDASVNFSQPLSILGSNLFVDNATPTAIVKLQRIRDINNVAVTDLPIDVSTNISVFQTLPNVLAITKNFNGLPLGYYIIKITHNGLESISSIEFLLTTNIVSMPFPNLVTDTTLGSVTNNGSNIVYNGAYGGGGAAFLESFKLSNFTNGVMIKTSLVVTPPVVNGGGGAYEYSKMVKIGFGNSGLPASEAPSLIVGLQIQARTNYNSSSVTIFNMSGVGIAEIQVNSAIDVYFIMSKGLWTVFIPSLGYTNSNFYTLVDGISLYVGKSGEDTNYMATTTLNLVKIYSL